MFQIKIGKFGLGRLTSGWRWDGADLGPTVRGSIEIITAEVRKLRTRETGGEEVDEISRTTS